ncbi:MAG TPA: exo-alpha-sialidase [Puia sp.]|nr:exo-alpha-sialidase [Puia sp.]
MKKIFVLFFIFLTVSGRTPGQGKPEKVQPVFQTLIFPLQPKHAHASSMVSLPNGDILAAWYQGSGEREANDVKIMGARLKKGSQSWSDPFVMADTRDIPDCNPVLFLSSHHKLFLFWIAVQAHKWEYSLLRCKTSVNYLDSIEPVWSWQDDILFTPDDHFAEEVASKFKQVPETKNGTASFGPRYGDKIIEASRDQAKRSLGWMTRIKPLALKNGRLLLPLYSDGFSMSMIALSDDDGETWRNSLPIVGRGNVQPALVQKKDGHVIAYMRDNGDDPNRVQVSESADSGFSWTAAQKINIPNTASVELIVLQDGRWAFIGDDEDDGRYRLSIYLSGDEGKTWMWKRTLEDEQKGKGSFSYPCIIQTADGLLHISYSYSLDKKGESIKYVVADPQSL